MKVKDLKITKRIKHDVYLNYVVQSVIYPEDPNTLFLTMRGGGITTYDISNPKKPKFLTHWDENKHRNVEGQDRIGNLLIVTDISRGGLFILDVSNPKKLTKLSYLNFKNVENVLHTKIYQDKGKTYALLTGGFHYKTYEPSDLFAIVDITDPKSPKLISKINTGVLGTEGISIKNHYAYVGGYMSSKFVVIDFSNPKNMVIVKELNKPYYRQMVSKIGSDGVLYAALWGEKGGLATFNIEDPKNIREISYITNKELSKANRVNISGDYIFIPLELKEGGGVGVIDRSNPKKLIHVKSFLNIPDVDKPYCLAVKGNYLYLFSSKNNSMIVMQIIKE